MGTGIGDSVASSKVVVSFRTSRPCSLARQLDEQDLPHRCVDFRLLVMPDTQPHRACLEQQQSRKVVCLPDTSSPSIYT
jgi:hypothetical protein